MFIIRCCNCGREQKWTSGIIVGQGTEIEIADKAVYCTCGAAIEEEDGVLVAYKTQPGATPDPETRFSGVRQFNVKKRHKG